LKYSLVIIILLIDVIQNYGFHPQSYSGAL